MMFNIQYAVSLCLLGLIWVVQLVHYPSFRYVEPSAFVDFEKFHSRSISLIVMPLMIGELITAFWLFSTNNIFLVINLVCVVLVWLSTFLLSVPCHHHLSKGKDSLIIERLIKTNWIRTILWSFKFGVLFWLQTHL